MPAPPARRLISHRHPLLYHLAVFFHRQKRKLVWLGENVRFARTLMPETTLPHNVKRHASRLIRVLGNTEIWIQENKVHNISLCLPHIDGLLIRPGESFSFCKLVGKPTRKRGFRDGMELSMGVARVGVGGG